MKLKLKTFKFSNVFAYGESNVIDFDSERVTLVVGDNGVGKSSIPNALEETLYSKNSRGIKKASVKNRNATNPMEMQLTFELGEDLYELSKVTKASAKVSLKKNGADISGHTATQTYKLLESEIGLDFATFSKLVYQSTKSSLDFLSATDTNRKKFLISLLGLEQYAEVEIQLKDALKSAKGRLDAVNASISTAQNIMKKNKCKTDEVLEEVPIPEQDENLIDTSAMLRMKQSTIDSTNKQIQQANQQLHQARTEFSDAEDSAASIIEVQEFPDYSEQITELKSEVKVMDTKMASVKKVYQNFKSDAETTECPTCGTTLDKSESQAAMEKAKAEWLALRDERTEVFSKLEEFERDQVNYTHYVDYLAKDKKAKRVLAAATEKLQYTVEHYGKYEDMELESVDSIAQEIVDLQVQIRQQKQEIEDAIEKNKQIAAKNAAREAALTAYEQAKEELVASESQLDEIQQEVTELDILAKAFGSKGLVAYKIESSVKALEDSLNHYLSILTAGRFALGFELNGAKLDVVVYDNGQQVEVNSLSTGQFTNVQFSTLLAIRSILSAINSVDINVLYIDEGISFLDKHAKDRLVDLLLEETELNTFIVSHGYSHPLATTLGIELVDGVSKIVTK